jgi:hypothetical protein
VAFRLRAHQASGGQLQCAVIWIAARSGVFLARHRPGSGDGHESRVTNRLARQWSRHENTTKKEEERV